METSTTTVDFPPFFNPTAINSCFDQESQDDDDDDDDEVLSLRDLPLTTATTTTSSVDHHLFSSSSSNNHSRSTSFEFCTNHHHHNNDDDDDLLHDVISDGHLLPFTHPRRSLSLSSAATRFSSLTESQIRTSSPAAASTIRHSRSLNHRKLRRGGESNVDKSTLYRTSSTSSSRINNTNSENMASSRWYYWLVFGLPMRIPAEMAAKSITRSNSRSRRNIPPASFLPVGRWCDDEGSTAAATRLLSVLSCKSHGSVDVINTQY